MEDLPNTDARIVVLLEELQQQLHSQTQYGQFSLFHLGQCREIASGLTEVSHQVVYMGRVRPGIYTSVGRMLEQVMSSRKDVLIGMSKA